MVMFVFFLIGSGLRNHGLVDIAWGLGICLVALRFLFWGEIGPLQVGSAVLVIIWGLRLSGYLFSRNWGKPEDFRYAAWRMQWGSRWWWRSFFQVYLLQGLLQLIVVMPLILVFGSGPSEIGWFEWVGAGLAWSGLVIEAVADAQKFRFKQEPRNRDRLIMSGLWRYSRHPNYFGDAVFWWGIGLMCVRAKWGWIGLASPILMNWLLLKVSGVPLLEERWASRPEFEGYRKRTNRFVPGRVKFD